MDYYIHTNNRFSSRMIYSESKDHITIKLNSWKDFTLNVTEYDNIIMEIFCVKKYTNNYKMISNKKIYNKQKIKLVLEFKLNYKLLDSINDFNENYQLSLKYPYFNLIFKILEYKLPNELIYIILSYLDETIEYNFKISKLQNYSNNFNTFHISDPIFFIPKSYLNYNLIKSC